MSTSAYELPRLKVAPPADDHYRQLIACQAACPVHTDARGYVRAIAAGRFEEAYLLARGPNPFASICGRICAAPCEASCRRGQVPVVDDDGAFVRLDRPIAIRALKRFACERHGPEANPPERVLARLREHVPEVAADAEEMAALLCAATRGRFQPANGESVGIVGAGPAGLAAAHDLALLGFRPVVYEAESVAAGMLAVGVPAYRLPRELIRHEVAVIEALGVDIRCGVRVGRDLSFAELRAQLGLEPNVYYIPPLHSPPGFLEQMFGPGVEEAIATYRKADDDLAGLLALFGSTERIVPRWKRKGDMVIGLEEDGTEIVRVPLREPVHVRLAFDQGRGIARTNCP